MKELIKKVQSHVGGYYKKGHEASGLQYCDLDSAGLGYGSVAVFWVNINETSPTIKAEKCHGC
jgi:hypothetical protein